ncbi:19283_t:CDS:2, partial [Dentiscutata erythropus]
MLFRHSTQRIKLSFLNKCGSNPQRFLSVTQPIASKIGRKLIRYPPEVLIIHDQTPITQPRVKADLNSTTLTISGPLGAHSMPLKPYIHLQFYESKIPYVKPEDRKPITNEDDFIDESDFDKKLRVSVQHPENKEQKTMWGTTRALIANYIRGVSEGYRVSLKFVGVGYRASLESDGKLYLEVGYVNPVVMEIPPGLKCIVPTPTKIILSGTDKQLVYRFAAQIREHRKPEPYNQKVLAVTRQLKLIMFLQKCLRLRTNNKGQFPQLRKMRKMIKFSFVILLATILTVLVAGLRIKIQDSIDLTYSSEFQLSNLQNEEKRLIQTSPFKSEWMTEEQVWGLIRNKIKFMDITDYSSLGTHYKTFKKRVFPVNPAFENEVVPLINKLTTKYMRKNLEKFTSFRNRYYRSKYGAESSQWLYDQVVNIVKNANYSDAILSAKQFTHKWDQKSIIARFQGSDDDKDNEVVIVGAHQDSVNMWMPSFGRAPGADDDGSGTVTILEAFRALAEGQFRPRRSVEFHWYSAEEGGLLGSQAIASHYEELELDVIAMLQNDMTGYIGKKYPETFGIVVDFVDPDLTEFIKKLINSYAKLPARDTKCGYACSDHASWRKAGYPSAFAIEGAFDDSNPYIHTSNDVIENLSFDHMLEFSK